MANIDPNSAIGQAQDANNAFAEFFAGVYQFLANGGSCPEFSDFLERMDYSELLRIAVSGQTGSPSYPGAAAVENVHQIVAVLREYGLRTKGKNQYYEDGQSDVLNESNFYATMKIHWVSMLNGVYVAGATS